LAHRLQPDRQGERAARQGREAIYFGNDFAVAAAKPLPEYAVRYYVRILRSDRDALRGSFGFYRALDTTIAQNQQRMTRRLTLPVLAIGAQFSFGAGVGDAMRLVADDVQSLVIPGVGTGSLRRLPRRCWPR
jgi:hypothetical protein